MDDFGNELNVGFQQNLRACYFAMSDGIIEAFVEFVLTYMKGE